MKRICKECGKEFELSPGEIQFYNSKNLALPKRCKGCREKNSQGKKAVHGSVPEENSTGRQDRKASQDTSQGNNINNDTQGNIQHNVREGAQQGKTRLANGRNKFVTAAVLVICIIAVLSGRQLSINENDNNISSYKFRNSTYLTEHFEKHNSDFDYATEEEYLAGANRVISADNVLHKTEAEDGDDVYYLEDTNEFVIVSTDGYIRTYFKPEDGIEYFNRQ